MIDIIKFIDRKLNSPNYINLTAEQISGYRPTISCENLIFEQYNAGVYTYTTMRKRLISETNGYFRVIKEITRYHYN